MTGHPMRAANAFKGKDWVHEMGETGLPAGPLCRFNRTVRRRPSGGGSTCRRGSIILTWKWFFRAEFKSGLTHRREADKDR
jgi:hypothetical protein